MGRREGAHSKHRGRNNPGRVKFDSQSVRANLSLLHTGVAIQTKVDVSMVVEELLEDIQHSSHLSENQNSVASDLQLSQQSVESL